MFHYSRLAITVLTIAILSSITTSSAFAHSRNDSYHRHDSSYQHRQNGWYDRNGHFHHRERNWYHRS
jgi:hypothetical protein